MPEINEPPERVQLAFYDWWQVCSDIEPDGGPIYFRERTCRWTLDPEWKFVMVYKLSCGKTSASPSGPFCPHCGGVVQIGDAQEAEGPPTSLAKCFDNEEMNVLLTALLNCGDDYVLHHQVGKTFNREYNIYEWLAHTPKTSLTVELSQKLTEMGYEISRFTIDLGVG